MKTRVLWLSMVISAAFWLENGSGAGAAIFGWETKLTGMEQFGSTVAIDGDTVVVGTPYEQSETGAVYVYTRTQTGWGLQARLTAGDGGPGQWFGISLVIQGDTLLVGAGSAVVANQSCGAVYLFTRTGITWTQKTRLTAHDAAPNAHFGQSIALSGNTLAIGAGGDREKGDYAGAVYVFIRNRGVWTENAKLMADQRRDFEYMGWQVAIDGDTIIGGAQMADGQRGAVYVFVRRHGVWSQQARLVGNETQAGDTFGVCMTLREDLLVVGTDPVQAPGSPRTGAAYVFRRHGAVWSQEARLQSDAIVAGDGFGTATAFSVGQVLVGAKGDSSLPGSVYTFEKHGTDWIQDARFLPSDPSFGDAFGWSMAVDGNRVVVGAPGHANWEGAAYVYTRDTKAPVIRSITASPNRLQPPNGALVPVTITVKATDNLDPSLRSQIVVVVCNDPTAREGMDWIVTGDLALQLRAVTNKRGSERVYTILVQCMDGSANASFGTVKVTVLRTR